MSIFTEVKIIKICLIVIGVFLAMFIMAYESRHTNAIAELTQIAWARRSDLPKHEHDHRHAHLTGAVLATVDALKECKRHCK